MAKYQEALRLLDDLESSSTPLDVPPDSSVGIGVDDSVGPDNTATSSSSSRTTRRLVGGGGGGGGGGEASAFLDELQPKASEPMSRPSSTVHNPPISRSGTPTMRKSTERVKLGGGASSIPLQRQLSLSSSSSSGVDSPNTKGIVPSVTATTAANDSTTSNGSGGSGWGWTTSAWGAASSMLQQAKNVVDEQVKHLPTRNEQARKWGEGMLEYAKNTQLDKLGQDFKRVGLSTLTDILNVVAPPISEHEVIQVWLSHDMQGYDGIESLTYRSLTRIMEQVEGGDLIVNRGNESKPKESSHRNLNAADDYEVAIKLCQANIDQLVKSNGKSEPRVVDKPASLESSMSMMTPTTYSHVYLRIQPFFTILPAPSTSDIPASMDQQQFSFLVYLSDPEHQLIRMTTTQSVPCQWLEIFDDHEWVEELIAEVLRVGVEVIGQEYIVARMGWAGKGGQPMKEEAGSI